MSELAAKLAHRNAVNDGEECATFINAPTNVYTEFKEFTRKQIKEYEKTFIKYDVDGDKVINQKELQVLMQKIGAPQTYLGLKEMIKEVDEDGDGAISFREFLLIFRKAAAGEFVEGSGLSQLARLSEIDVDETGVGGAKDFFEAKIVQASGCSQYEIELKQEQDEKKRESEAAKQRKEAFKQRQNTFQ